ncbi:hypothetical protein [Salmonella enterica]|nr:hypothetical protein [Salmonella enterica]
MTTDYLQQCLRKSNGNHMQVMFDWVSRITSSDYAE